jgi:hypothetical protein
MKYNNLEKRIESITRQKAPLKHSQADQEEKNAAQKTSAK